MEELTTETIGLTMEIVTLQDLEMLYNKEEKKVEGSNEKGEVCGG